jgi:phage terminase large subunit-like protein
MSKVTEYAKAIKSGEITANKWVKLAANRHLKDLKEKKWLFDESKAKQVFRFFEILRHTKGEMAGQPFKLEDWQKFIIGSIFGWVDEYGRRRYRRAYIEIGRKNGKTTLAAGVALYGLLVDDEEAPEIYTAATKLDQAAICYEEAFRMCENEYLQGEITAKFNSHNNRTIVAGNGKMKPLSSEHKTLDGLNPHYAIIDEYHAHPNDELYNVIRNGMGARAQPLLFTITTAGFNRESACYKHREYCQKVLEGQIEDDRLFAIMYSLDAGDEWTDEKNWIKANPNYGISVNPDHVIQQLSEAKEIKSKEVEFRTKLLNEWTDSAITWIADSTWKQGAKEVEVVAGAKCWAGLDLASSKDFSAACRVFETTRGIEAEFKFWLPEEAVKERKDGAGDSIRKWVDMGYIVATPGNVTDYDYIKRDLLEWFEDYELQTFNYDRYNSTQLVINLMNEGLPMNAYSQGIISMNTPVREIERLAGRGQLIHGGNPVMNWMISNVMLKSDSGGNVKIDKERSSAKVDGPVALAMALAGYLDEQREDKSEWFEPIYL